MPTPPIITDAPTVTTIVPESNALTAVELRVVKLEKDMYELKTIDHSSEALAVLQSYLTKKPKPTAKQESKKSPSDILKIKTEQAEKRKKPQFTIKSTDKAALIEDENIIDKGVADTIKDYKRRHDDDEDPPAGPNQCTKTKSRRTKESESSKKPSTTKETLKDDAGDDVVHDDDQPQAASKPNTSKTLNPECIELEYNFQECFNTLTDKLDWNNPEGDRYPFDLSKPLPIQGPSESYQKKLNVTKPQKTFPKIEFKEPYTPSYDPPGIVYEDLDKQKIVLQADELYKFSNGTLKSVRNENHHRLLNFHLDYNKEKLKRK
nr:hypothetical protein [Tanacetum cinerariifolium]